MSGFARDKFRAENFGIIFQQFNLLPYLNVLENVKLGLRFSRARKRKCPNVNAAARQILKDLGIDDFKRLPHKLSIGQQQRAAAARAMIGSPEIIIADESTSSLDFAAREKFISLLFSEIDKTQSCLLFVSHDVSLADKFSRVIKLEDINEDSAASCL